MLHAEVTTTQIAPLMKVTPLTIRNWWNGVHEPSLKQLGQLAYILDQDICSFIDPVRFPFKRNPQPRLELVKQSDFKCGGESAYISEDDCSDILAMVR